MILIAFILAVPVAWYVMENWWLLTFAYRIDISVWIFLLSGTAALLIAWIHSELSIHSSCYPEPDRRLA